ncbi:non-ribosomal peptide synthetase [Streptomyces sp. RTGN2]|uniref:non-ribosomal peptide synthetase n=1 Tax=Streptomyces sp. RTGN2 TaxID=3016525 RepID=UPI0025528672|nr:non-ribosomal peptide synthetase [Streptomyces sp. RTGN2]
MKRCADDKDGEAGREYWRGVLDAGGFTPLPRWTAAGDCADESAAAFAEHRTPLAGTPVTAPALLAAHAKVIAALTGDSETLTGFRQAGQDALPVRINTADGTWDDLVGAARAGVAALARYAGQAPDSTGTHGGSALFDSLVTAPGAGAHAPAPAGTVLDVHTDGDDLVVRHRTDTLDAAAAARIAGYYLTALRRIAEDSGAPHGERSLLSDAELRHQTEELAGPEREVPDRRFHELFEARVRSHPGAVAAVLDGRSLTYAELNERANRVAWALRLGGLWDEDVVAVVTERDLEWLAAVIGVFKAGGVYLPVEPHFPAARIAAVLTRSACHTVLTTREVCPALDRAVAESGADPVVTFLDELPAGLPGTDPRFPVPGDAAAYIYFTSGSTGEPKGAVCEHAGFVNHLLAKIEDLGVTEGTVVAQTAPQCFDISLWQLVAALVTGGTTHIVAQDAVLDVGRFVETLRVGRVEVAQLVPSYLEVLLTYLNDDGRTALPDLRAVSATGEALKKELVERWFTSFPGVTLCNAYGLTETCDDTNHEVMHRPPAGSSVPLGRPVRNVRVYVVDERLQPVPLGSPGEIVFSGVCVGRGYVNDEVRSKAAFMTDPHRPGERLYRSGDFGRWMPDGRLEFHGRRDAQLKIRGFRIEIGEIENRLLEVAGVRDGAVVAAGRGDARTLVGYYTGADGPHPDEVRDRLADTLPAYMVPARLERRPTLPLTSNGKTDRKALTREAEGAGDHPAAHNPAGAGSRAPGTRSEARLAALWADVLKVPVERIGRTAHFFEIGGTSLTAVRLAIALERLVTVGELARTPVLRDLAALLTERLAERADAPTAAVG